MSFFKRFAENSFLFLFCFLLFLLLREKSVLMAGGLSLVFYRYRSKDSCILLLLLIICLNSIPVQEIEGSCSVQGRVIRITQRTAVIQSGWKKYVVYTDDCLMLDSLVSIHGTAGKILASNGFYAFDAARYYHRMRVSAAITPEQVDLLKEGWTLRALMQKRIESIQDETIRSLLYRILLGLRTDDDLLRSSLAESGFSAGGFLVLVNRRLRKILPEKSARKAETVLIVSANLLYGFPCLLLQQLLYERIERYDLPAVSRAGIVYTAILLIHPESIGSVGLWLPLLNRLSTAFSEDAMTVRLLFSSVLQGLMFHKIRPLQSFLFQWLRMIGGMVWLVGFLRLFFSRIPLVSAVEIADRLYAMTDFLTISGSPAGSGAVFFILLLFVMKADRYYLKKVLVLYYLFAISGAFHPFAEVTFINVGQGDCILLKGMFKEDTWLVDTGKPSQYDRVSAFLDAKGITKLDGFFLTHDDNDHSGSRERIIRTYQPDIVTDTHFDILEGKFYVFADLNDIQDDDENRSSLVLYTGLGKTRILLMGDADRITEKRILERYPGLRCDLLKLSHHGSDTGNSEAFLKALHPQTGIVSSGAYEIYHHPSEAVVQRLMANRIPYWDTKSEGDITFLFLPFVNLLISSSGKIGIIHI